MAMPEEELGGIWKQERSHAHQTAPIAALFKDCLQCFAELCTIMAANEDAWKHQHVLVDGSFSKFREWGSDTGASNRSLDHALRKASRLQETTKEMLEALLSTLHETRGSLQNAAMPLLRAPISRIDYFHLQREDTEPVVSSRSSSGSETSIQQLIDDMEESVSCLIKLIPALQDPAPQDLYRRNASSSEADKDIVLAIKMFPKAAPALTRRLGFANWKRRQYLEGLQPPNRQTLSSKLTRNRSHEQDHDSGFFSNSSFRRSSYRIGFPSYGSITSRGTSEAGPSSVNDTIFSRPNYFSGDSAISVADSDRVVKWARYDIPRPPVMLRSGSEFTCPFCGQEIVFGIQITSDEDWAQHVLMDLEPYLCTFDDCIRADKTFGVREEWFQHELDNHRLRKVWSCQACKREFERKVEFELHLNKEHETTIGISDLSVMVSLCERFSEETPPYQPCPLCGYSITKSEVFKEHVADHMEQLALMSLQGGDGLEREVLSPFFAENASEKRDNLELLKELVKEQRDRIWQPTQEPTENDSANSNLAFAEDSDDEVMIRNPKPSNVKPTASSRPSRPPMQRRGDSWMMKVNSFLEQQPTNQADGDLWKTKVETFLEDQSMQEVLPIENDVLSPRIETPGIALSSQVQILIRPLPAFRTKPPPRNADFIGRDRDMLKLHKILSVPGNTCVLTGAGGMGKTGAAIEYTYRYDAAYSYIFWVAAETAISCADTYSLIATQLVVTDDDIVYDQDRLITLGREFLEQTEKRWLLVFDNVNAWSDIQEYMPTDTLKAHGSILITSRKPDLRCRTSSPRCHTIELGVLTLEESRRLLLLSMQPELDHKGLISHPEYKLAGEIASLAERLPLALAHIAGYVQVSQCTLTDFVQLWNERRRHAKTSQQTTNPLTLATDKALETVWNIGLREVTMDARELLNILAFLNSETIQRKLLVGEHEEPSLDFLHSSQSFRYKRMITELSRRRLITVKVQDGEEVLSIHRSLQEKILQDLDKDAKKREEVFAQAFDLVRKRFPLPSPIQVPEPEKWPACREYLPHVLNVQKIVIEILPSIKPSVRLAQLLSDGGINLWERGMTSEGLRLLRSAEAILEKLDSQECQLEANIHIIIALLLQDYGLSNIAESKDRIWKALQIRKDLMSPTNLDLHTRNQDILLHNAWSDYGCVLLQYNKYQEAEPIFRQCLAKYHEWGTEAEIPYEYYKYNHHTAFCRLYHRDFTAAIALAEESLRCIILATGQSSATNKTKFDLACIILQSGDLQRSLDLHREVLDSRLKQHGKFSFLTLQSYYAVGALCAYSGDLPEAEHLLRHALTSAQSRPGSWSEAAVARAEFHLSHILTQQEKDVAEAQELAARAREVLARLLPLSYSAEEAEVGKGVEGKGVGNEVGTENWDELPLFDHLQPVFDGRFTGRGLLGYIAQRET